MHVCGKLVKERGWTQGKIYSDMAISGTTQHRSGYQQMVDDAAAGKFQVLVAESLDRLSRDQEHIAALFKRMAYRGIPIVTLAEGEISEMHIGLNGTMSALYVKNLAQKTHRGLEGRVRAGKSGGGNSYGYRVVRQLNADGEVITGEREIQPDEADVVRRIFRDYVAGKSPRTIAGELNREGVSGPHGAAWGQSTIQGNRKRGTGILNNELYIGKRVWNRQRYVKDPETGRRQARPNPPEDWIVREVPELRIVDGELWEAVRRRMIWNRWPDFGLEGSGSVG